MAQVVPAATRVARNRVDMLAGHLAHAPSNLAAVAMKRRSPQWGPTPHEVAGYGCGMPSVLG